MSKEEKEAIEEYEKIIDNMYQEKMDSRVEKKGGITYIDIGKDVNFTKLEEASIFVLREELSLKRLVEKQQKLINQLLEDMKERANNFSFESEIMWRKIEKAEELLEEK